MDFGVENLSKINKKIVKKDIKSHVRFEMDFGGLLERFGGDFGSKLGLKWEPS